MSLKEFIHEGSCTLSILACIFLTFTYVASLYIWRSSLNRDHPTTIKRRFFSVFGMMLFAPLFVQLFYSKQSLSRGDVYELFGLRGTGLITASILPLFLTAILFLGPLTMQVLSGSWKLYIEPQYWLSSWQDLVWVRNHIMAPLSEEWVFRACMMPLLLQCLQPLIAVFLGPFLFGVAHFHHMYEQMKAGLSFKTAFSIAVFQFSYTSMFGAYSSYIFVRTGHFIAPLLAHIFCNHMGFPNINEIVEFPAQQRRIIIFNFVVGFILWCFLLNPLTSPEIYDNRLHWGT